MAGSQPNVLAFIVAASPQPELAALGWPPTHMNLACKRSRTHAAMNTRIPHALARALGPPALAAVLAIGGPLGCKDEAKESADRASRDDAFIVDLVEKDIAEVERGLPQGAERLAPLVAPGTDPRQEVAEVRRALLRMRRDVMDLNVAKSTFFALADPNGIAIRNDLEEDVMAGQDLFTVFPALAKAKTGYVTTTGAFPNPAPKNGPDKDWIAALPVNETGRQHGRHPGHGLVPIATSLATCSRRCSRG